MKSLLNQILKTACSLILIVKTKHNIDLLVGNQKTIIFSFVNPIKKKSHLEMPLTITILFPTRKLKIKIILF